MYLKMMKMKKIYVIFIRNCFHLWDFTIKKVSKTPLFYVVSRLVNKKVSIYGIVSIWWVSILWLWAVLPFISEPTNLFCYNYWVIDEIHSSRWITVGNYLYCFVDLFHTRVNKLYNSLRHWLLIVCDWYLGSL